MRATMLTAAAAAALALAGCTMENKPADAVVVTDGTNVAVATPVDVVAPGATAPLPMLGAWTCESTGFTITPGTYRTAGGSQNRIASVERLADNDYRLVLSDAKKIRLSNIIDGKLTWRHENAEGGEKAMTCTKRL